MGPQPSAAAFRAAGTRIDRLYLGPIVLWSQSQYLLVRGLGIRVETRQCQLLLSYSGGFGAGWLAVRFGRNASRAANMSNKIRVRARWLVVAAILALAQSASVTVQAQSFWNWNQQDQYNRQQSRPQSGGFLIGSAAASIIRDRATTITTVHRAGGNINTRNNSQINTRNNSRAKARVRRRRKKRRRKTSRPSLRLRSS